MFYALLIRVVSLFNNKAKLWVDGRKNWKKEIECLKGEKVLWVHAASLGEFEQGKPIIEKLKNEYPSKKILLTFFSPSGYEVRKNFKLADKVMYIPIDTPSNVRWFIKNLDLELAVFIKYEFWFNFLHQLKKSNVPVVFFSTIFREKQSFFKFYGRWFLKHLKGITKIFVQNEESINLLNAHGLTNVDIAGDTRFDSVIETQKEIVELPKFKSFLDGEKCILFGSAWPQDITVASSFINEYNGPHKIVIAPHEIGDSQLQLISAEINKSIAKYSDDQPKGEVLIINSIGVLKYMYKDAVLSVIGGGFGKGIHNILEALVTNQPVLFGPNFQKFQEAKDAIKLGIAFDYTDSISFRNQIENLLNDEAKLEMISEKAKTYIAQNKGASEKIFQFIEELIKDE